MAARSGMSTLIGQVRRLVADEGSAVWTTDDEVEDSLDQTRIDIWSEELTPSPIHSSGDIVYYDYLLARADVEGTASGTLAWRLYDSNGDDATGYTLTGDRGLVHFHADQAGTTYWADYRTYDPFAAAADLWEERAADLSGRYDFTTGAASFKASQWFDHCTKMADRLRKQSKPVSVQMTRGDVVE